MSLSLIELGLNRPLPIEITKITEPFWEGLTEGDFLVARCNNCRRLSFPPRAICPQCHAREFDWQPVSGRGTLYSVSKVEQSPSLYGILSPMRVAVVDLEEGIRIVTRLLPGSNNVEIDANVKLVITSHPDGYHYAARMDDV
jgi:uncharacterized protein